MTATRSIRLRTMNANTLDSIDARDASVSHRTRRKIARRILPFVFLLYVFCYIDRAAVAFANIPMSKDLNFSEGTFGFGAGVFFLGYFLLEIPGTLIVERWSARLWIARICISWGIVTGLAGLIHSASQFYGARFLLGAAEAGLFPGIIVYLTHWFSIGDRARALAGFAIAAPVALTLSAPWSALILHLPWAVGSGWRWLFVLDGIPSVILGVVTLFLLTDRPRDAKWLEPEERAWIGGVLDRENASKPIGHSTRWWTVFYQREVLILTLAAFCANVGGYGFVLWLPNILDRGLGLPPTLSTVLSALPYAVGIGASLWIGRRSDRRGGSKMIACGCFLLGGLSLALVSIPGQPVYFSLLWLTATGAAAYGYMPAFWILPTLLTGEMAAAASIGLINSVGNLGGFVGPWVIGALRTRGWSPTLVMLFPGVFYFLAAILTFLVRIPAVKVDAEIGSRSSAGRKPG
jgi:ACS family tartrate transporter-like MFS transporter